MAEIPGAAVLRVSAALEAITGLALLVAPAAVALLLLGGPPPDGSALALRSAGLGLLGLAWAAWLGAGRVLLAYNILAALALAGLGLAGFATGWLLWPAVLIHAAIAMLMLRNGGP